MKTRFLPNEANFVGRFRSWIGLRDKTLEVQECQFVDWLRLSKMGFVCRVPDGFVNVFLGDLRVNEAMGIG